MNEPATWTINLRVPEGTVDAMQDALELFSHSIAAFEEGGGGWRLTAYCESAPDRGEVTAAVAVAAARAGVEAPDVVVTRLESRDWLAENRASFPLIHVGRYVVQGLEDETPTPSGAIVIRLNAGPAFGSGSHETTQGCLALLDGLARTHRFRNPVDLGCGSGILAIAIAKTWKSRVLALDMDPAAVANTRENAARNGVSPLIEARTALGFLGVTERLQPAGHDLIVANILANPLIEMAGEMGRYVGPGGVLILSGLLREQANSVLSHYRARGFTLAKTETRGPWVSLQLVR